MINHTISTMINRNKVSDMEPKSHLDTNDNKDHATTQPSQQGVVRFPIDLSPSLPEHRSSFFRNTQAPSPTNGTLLSPRGSSNPLQLNTQSGIFKTPSHTGKRFENMQNIWELDSRVQDLPPLPLYYDRRFCVTIGSADESGQSFPSAIASRISRCIHKLNATAVYCMDEKEVYARVTNSHDAEYRVFLFRGRPSDDALSQSSDEEDNERQFVTVEIQKRRDHWGSFYHDAKILMENVANPINDETVNTIEDTVDQTIQALFTTTYFRCSPPLPASFLAKYATTV